jgi:hypothetical protein
MKRSERFASAAYLPSVYRLNCGATLTSTLNGSTSVNWSTVIAARPRGPEQPQMRGVPGEMHQAGQPRQPQQRRVDSV